MRTPRFEPSRFSIVSCALALGCCATGTPAFAPEAPPPPIPALTPAKVTQTTSGYASAFPVPEHVRGALAAPDRSEEDRALDAGRMPDQLLAFFGVASGMRVAELGAGGGYTAELLVRAVGAEGTVYAQNSHFVLERFAEKPWSQRLQKPIMKKVVRADRDFDDPLPPEAKNLDAVFLILLYHDTVWMKVDRERMNRNVFAALKPGGVYAIVDHGARAGAGVADVETLHRIEEKVVRDEVERAGFLFDASANFLSNAEDARDWNASPRTAAERRGTSHRFVLRYKKPG